MNWSLLLIKCHSEEEDLEVEEEAAEEEVQEEAEEEADPRKHLLT